ncbi:nuclear transport factor 2 family protein [Spongiimicrobium salis]|uniref:nuclear transport factor 2 family protein n=1 Tax=Spongiimicrobium salis TaxID=1667022 RepID=UPI00374CE1C8
MSYKTYIILGMIGFASCKSEKKEVTIKNEEKMEITKREKTEALLRSLETGDSTAVNYIHPEKYIQHNLGVADGLEGFGAVLQNAPNGGFKAKVIRTFEDGDYTFAHTVYDFFGPKIGFDVFRFENGKIVEHWDNLIAMKSPNPSGRTQVDGETTITDLEKTAENKTLVRNFVSNILVQGQMDRLGDFIEGDQYLQHNPDIADGLSGLGAALEAMQKNGIAMVYHKVHKVLGEGNFVLAISEGSFAGVKVSYYDLFRVAQGKIVEHWDVVEEIAPESEWKHHNGKFNFPE